MSWIDKVNIGLEIVTGDGEIYKPLWKNASKSTEYHVSEFEFINTEGTLVDRRLPKGNRYTLEIYFQGDDHLDISEKFLNSAKNTKYWTLRQPFYGWMYVQPLSINQDNTEYNISKFTIPIVETIINPPKTKVSDLDSISIKKLAIDNDIVNSIKSPIESSSIDSLKKQNKKRFDVSVPIIKVPSEFTEYQNTFNKANSLIDTATASPLEAMRVLVNAITAPSRFVTSASNRINALSNQFTTLHNTLANLITPSSKELYQLQAGTIISSMCIVVTSPFAGDFSNNKKVNSLLNTINSTYSQFLADLDNLQSINGGNPLSFIPDFNTISGLNDLINTTTSYLLTAVIGARREYSIILEEDSNLILLTHRFYGLDMYDNNMIELKDNNDLSLNELIIIPKGRKILYYL